MLSAQAQPSVGEQHVLNTQVMGVMEVNSREASDQWLAERDLHYEEIWNIIPPCDNYLKNIMQFCGYVRKARIVKLTEKHEMDKIFAFMESMSEAIEDNKLYLVC